MTGPPVKVIAVASRPMRPQPDPRPFTADVLCGLLAQWADVASVSNAGAGIGHLAVMKSDLLARLVYGRERGPSQTKCPVHQGKWSGCHYGWPGDVWISVGDGERVESPMNVEPRMQEWYDAGCRCFQHAGSSCTTGWNPDEHCCLPEPVR